MPSALLLSLIFSALPRIPVHYTQTADGSFGEGGGGLYKPNTNDPPKGTPDFDKASTVMYTGPSFLAALPG